MLLKLAIPHLQNQPPEVYESSTQSWRVSAVSTQFGSDVSLIGAGETAPRSLEDCAALACEIAVPPLTGHLQHAQSAQTPQDWPAVCQTHTRYCGDMFLAQERERSDAQGALASACLYGLKAFPKGKGCLRLEHRRRILAPPPLYPSDLAATPQAFEHSMSDTLLRSLCLSAPSKRCKSLQHAADIRAEADTENLEVFSRWPTTGILRLPTYAGATYALIARSSARRKFHFPCNTHAQRPIFRAFVTQSRRTLVTRGRVGSAVWAAAVVEGYPTRGEVHKAGGGEVGGQSSVLFLFPSTVLLYYDLRPRRRLSTWPSPSTPSLAMRSVPSLPFGLYLC